jgi:hypothetical protein
LRIGSNAIKCSNECEKISHMIRFLKVDAAF